MWHFRSWASRKVGAEKRKTSACTIMSIQCCFWSLTAYPSNFANNNHCGWITKTPKSPRGSSWPGWEEHCNIFNSCQFGHVDMGDTGAKGPRGRLQIPIWFLWTRSLAGTLEPHYAPTIHLLLVPLCSGFGRYLEVCLQSKSISWSEGGYWTGLKVKNRTIKVLLVWPHT